MIEPRTVLRQKECEEAWLGNLVAQHPITLTCAQAMARNALRYMQARSKRMTPFLDFPLGELEQLITACGQPLDEPFAGRIGFSVEKLSRVFQGYGNIRELVTHTWRFMNNVFCHDFVGLNQIEDAFLIAEEAGLNIVEIKKMIEEAKHFHSLNLQREQASSSYHLNPKDDWIKMPWSHIRQAQIKMRISKMSVDSPEVWSQINRTQFESEGGSFSDTEKSLRNPRGDAYVPWLDGRHIWALDETDSFVQQATQANLPLMTGISGFSVQIMQFCRLLNAGSDIQSRLVCIGYLLPIKSHSLHEVMSAGTAFGCSYNHKLTYKTLDSLTD